MVSLLHYLNFIQLTYVGADGDELLADAQAVREAARLLLQSDGDIRGTVALLS